MPSFNCPPLRFWRVFSANFILLAIFLSQFLVHYHLGTAFAVAPVVALVALQFWRTRWLGSMTYRTWRFRRRATSRIILYYPAQLEGCWDWSVLLQRIESACEELTQQFGFGLRSRVAVFLFPAWQDIARIFGREYGCVAIPAANAIAIAEDTNLVEMWRHELAHLFSARWNGLAPPILNEGLATWWQRTHGGQPVDALAETLLERRSLDLASLLKWKGYFSRSRRNDYYMLAGGFTGFLIRRFGWESYGKFYRSACGFNFRSGFKKAFGISLDRAECLWRYEKLAQNLLARRLHRA